MPSLTQQQELAATMQSDRILVSAGAGSGKTHVLVERYIERLKNNPELSVSNLIAVTFTRKAASEMRIRLKARMRELCEQSSPEERQRWSSCVAEIDGSRIGTIHSLCESIIRTFPLDAEVDPQLEVLDDLAQARLIGESIDNAFREAISEQSNEHEVLLEFDLPQIRRWLTATLKAAPQFEEAIAPVKHLSQEELRAHAEKILLACRKRALEAVSKNDVIGRYASELSSCLASDMTSSLNELRLAAVGYASQILTLSEDDASPEQLSACWQAVVELSQLKPGNSGGNKEGAKAARAMIRSLRELCQSATERLPDGLKEVDDRAFALSAGFIALAARTNLLYQRGKRELLVADYNDLIALALQALKRPGSASRRFYNENAAEILVDEFQDTNRAQTELLGLLTGSHTSLFMIGDEKQSIYKFQGADVSVFKGWKQSIGEADGALLSLSRSFRSHPRVVDFVNWLFSGLMSGDANIYSASFEALDAARTGDDSSGERVDVVVYTPAETDSFLKRSDNSRRAEAAVVCDWILDKVRDGAPVEEKNGSTRPIKFGDFAVLVQRNKDFAWMEDAFIKAEIPYVMLGGKGFLERQEIYDMQNLLAFLASPLDDHSLLGVLRSPIYAISDYLLHAISAGRSSSTSLWQCLCSAARQRKPGYEVIRTAVASLKRMMEESRKMRLSELLRHIIERTGYDIVLLGLPNGKQRSRNLWKLVALAGEKDEMSCAEFAATLQLMRDFNVQKTDAALDTRDSVKLITIHSSKGLEFPAVILPVLDVSAAAFKDRLTFHREYGLAINTARSDGDEKPAFYDIACSINDEMELAEKQRLFYVAATRARDYLGVFFDATGRNTPSFRLWLKERLGLRLDDELGWTVANHSGPCSVKFVGEDEEVSQTIDEAVAAQSSSHWLGFACAPCELVDCQPVETGPPERLLARLADASSEVRASAEIKKSINWDLIWPSMAGELIAPPADSGVRITSAPSRQHLESTRVGTYFHALMENMPANLSALSDELMRSIAIAQGEAVADQVFLDQLVQEGKRLYDIFLASDLYTALKTARRRLHELPYLFGQDKPRSKRPDLIFEDQNHQWHIVDYKTDFVQDSDVSASLAKHALQLSEYVSDLHELTGLTFAPSVYFAQLGRLVLSHDATQPSTKSAACTLD